MIAGKKLIILVVTYSNINLNEADPCILRMGSYLEFKIGQSADFVEAFTKLKEEFLCIYSTNMVTYKL